MRGKVFKLKEEEGHPWFIISHEIDGKVLAVNVSDANKHPDSTCVINQGAHDVIVKDSAVLYWRAREMIVSKLEKSLSSYAYVYPDCSEPLLQAIINGARDPESGLTLKFKKYLV